MYTGSGTSGQLFLTLCLHAETYPKRRDIFKYILLSGLWLNSGFRFSVNFTLLAQPFNLQVASPHISDPRYDLRDA
ncbi:hypothetical protein Hypma_007503 [Hypsizygus marmoreus]|uniref:Uncharacterized protein n=1 Tax=Hypsizygus marmoreus TaxID=39966 RepID=A0A369JW98_HYPMA|nr:hypothetical protein Hypma_007503 [Hypsizygus marmoreus]